MVVFCLDECGGLSQMCSSTDADDGSSDSESRSDSGAGQGSPAGSLRLDESTREATSAATSSAEMDGLPRSGEWLDTRSGHGAQSSREDWVRSNHGPISHDGRGLTRTTFYPEDAPTVGPGQAHRDHDEQRSWSDLAKWNDGMYSDISRGGQNFKADKRRWIDTFASQLGATSHHQERTEWILDRLDMGPFMGARIPSEGVILGVLSLVIDADVREFENRAVERDAMQKLLGDLELDRQNLVQIRQHLHKTASDLIDPDAGHD